MYNETTGDAIRNTGESIKWINDSTRKASAPDTIYNGHEAGERLSFAFAKRELASVGMSIRKVDGEYTVYPTGMGSGHGYFTTSLADALTTGRINAASLNMQHVTMTLALADPFQPMAHEADAWGGRLSAGQAREWAAFKLSQISAFDANVIAKLLEDRAAMCARNGLQCDDLDAGVTANYWRDQQAHASNLAAQFRKAGK